MFTQKLLATTTVEALATELGVIGYDALADGEALDFWAYRGNYANCLMSYGVKRSVPECECRADLPLVADPPQ